jgi:phospholipid-binding lipoprotein MlaA
MNTEPGLSPPASHPARGLAGARRTARPLVLVLLLLGAAGCASVPAEQDDGSNYDPLEPLNRKVFAFNQATDRVLLRPIARGYDRVIPDPVKTGVGNFFDNLSAPIWVINHLLQGNPGEAARQTGRFLMNTTFGLGGVLDPASRNGLGESKARFDQTFGKWGIPSGPYLVVPFLGPNTPRSGLAWYARFQTDIIWNRLDDNRSVRDKLVALEFIDLRYRLLRVDRMMDEAPDPYIFMREAYRQRVEYEIRGEVSLEEEFDFEFDDDP